MNRRRTVLALVSLCAAPLAGKAQQPRLFRVGVILHGGAYAPALDGLRDGLKVLGLEEGKQYVLHLRDTGGELGMVQGAARALEAEKVDLIYTVSVSVTLATKRATQAVPIVFYAGSDPAANGLVESYNRPGGRLTGFHGRFGDLAAKRLQLLKEIVPSVRRVITFYNPANSAAQRTMRDGRDAARRLGVELIERPVGSVEALSAAVRALRPGDADAFFYLADAMVNSLSGRIIETANRIRLPTMFTQRESAMAGALASYGPSYYAMGRYPAKHVRRVLAGENPATLPVEQIDRPELVLNLKTAKALGIEIPQSVLLRADELIR